MPPKSAKAKNKRPLEEGDDNPRQPKGKAAKTKDSEPAEERAETSQTGQAGRTRRIPRGPKGEYFMPQAMPRECADVIKNIPMPSRWIFAIDAIPDRSMTLSSRKWWEEHGPWLEAHKKQLKLSAANWKMKDEAMKQDATVPDDEGNDDWDFVCRVAPSAELRSGEDEDEYDDEDEDEEDGQGKDKDKDKGKDKDKDEDDSSKKPYGKLASLHPEYPWIFTMLGEDRGKWWTQEALKRDQDDFSMHIYNDWTNYGMLETIENMLQQISDHLKPKSSYREFWPEVEGLALALRSNLLDFAMCDDSERCNKLIELVGFLSMTVIDALKKQDAFKPDSEIRNLGLVFAMLIKWGWEQITDYEFDDESGSWIYKVVDLAEEAGITLAGPTNFEDELNKMLEERARKAKAMKKWNNVNWANRSKTYATRYCGSGGGRSKHVLGGSQYDITKMSAAERKKHSLGGGRGLMMF
ncbi:hypothetical protein FDECE_2818 [Fusarium decemcellulare]|nr:hypothetical protein FDECE_2818 [Fusarium decemcellulare]